jgi:hypothetical protein
LGNPDSPWVRVEIVWKRSDDYEIHWGILDHQNWWSEFVQAYPITAQFAPWGPVVVERFVTRRKPETETFRETFIGMLRAGRVQYGGAFTWIRRVFGDQVALMVFTTEAKWGALDSFPDWADQWDFREMVRAVADGIVLQTSPENRASDMAKKVRQVNQAVVEYAADLRYFELELEWAV